MRPAFVPLLPSMLMAEPNPVKLTLAYNHIAEHVFEFMVYFLVTLHCDSSGANITCKLMHCNGKKNTNALWMDHFL